MKKIVIFGNSGSGKTTLAKRLVDKHQLAHLDLDSIAWLPTDPPQRCPLTQSQAVIESHCTTHQEWVIEGCYADLLNIAMNYATEAIFIDLSIDQCVLNAKNRPWESHKYESKEAQDQNLEMLIDWIKQYQTRDDEFSHLAHTKLFDAYKGHKRRVTTMPGST